MQNEIKVKINKLPKSLVEIEGEIDADKFESFYDKAIKYLGENIEIDGFRKGKAPESVLTSKISETRVAEEMAELALGEFYPKILEENRIDAIDRPQIMITKLARKNPLGFKITTAVLPEIELADYKKIAKEINEESKKEPKIEVTEEELDKTIDEIRKSRAPKVEAKEDGEIKDVEPILPELNDEFVQALGPFENVEDFKTKLRENIKTEKQNQAHEKRRLKLIEKIISDSKMDLPEILINSEIEKIMHRMESDISTMGLKFEDYLKHLQKTKEELRESFRSDGEQRAKLSLVLYEISKKESLKPEEKDVEHEVEHILEHYKDADPIRARAHTESVLTNEKVFSFLENL